MADCPHGIYCRKAEYDEILVSVGLLAKARDEKITAQLDKIYQLQDENQSLKAALRWCLENGVIIADRKLYEYEASLIEPPTELASVIAEAVKP